MKTILLVLLTFLLQSCEKENKSTNKINDEYYVIEIDSCEYIRGWYQLAHKGNCKYCKQRNK